MRKAEWRRTGPAGTVRPPLDRTRPIRPRSRRGTCGSLNWRPSSTAVVATRQLVRHGLDGARDHRARVDRGQLHPCVHRACTPSATSALTATGRFSAARARLRRRRGAAAGVRPPPSQPRHAGVGSAREHRCGDAARAAGGETRAGSAAHRCSDLDPRDVWTRDGIRVTSPRVARSSISPRSMSPDRPAPIRPPGAGRAARQRRASCWRSSSATAAGAARRSCAR